MDIAVLGGGPAGLYYSLLMKKNFPDVNIKVFERNSADDTFGWGVVFSDETLEHFELADEQSYQEIKRHFRSWKDIDIFHQGERIRSKGHGFCGLSRKRLLMILQERCRELGAQLTFQEEKRDIQFLKSHDLFVAADGINSFVREEYADFFKPHLDWRKCKFCWLGAELELEAFSFFFKQTPYGLFQVHAYPFEKGMSTWIVECQQDVFEATGLHEKDEEATLKFCQELFDQELQGAKLLANRSWWRSFPTISCESWHHENVVLLGDAAHTAHFSVGSGTKLAMEDGIALVESFQECPDSDISDILKRYEEKRWIDVVKLQRAAQTSLEWFENSQRYSQQAPLPFAFNLLTRSKRITYDNLSERDPELIDQVRNWYSKNANKNESSSSPGPEENAPVPVFLPYQLADLKLENRIVVSPMCQYSAQDGMPNDWHLVHYGSRAIGGAGLIITEMTNVSPEGRITYGCTGLYNQEQAESWKKIVKFVHEHSRAKIGIQLAHAGRKASSNLPWEGDNPLTSEQGAWQTYAPSALPFGKGWPKPKEMNQSDMEEVYQAFIQATHLAEDAGFDLLELHMAHGYLLSSFISPLSNQRKDQCGGSLENRMRYPLRILRGIREAWPKNKPISVRITGSDWVKEGGITPDQAVQIAKMLVEAGCDIIDVSSGGNAAESRPIYGRMYQVPFAEKIRYEADVPVMAVGGILDADFGNTVLAAERADLVMLARPHLKDAYLSLHAAEKYEHWQQHYPLQYLAAQPQRPSQQRRLPFHYFLT